MGVSCLWTSSSFRISPFLANFKDFILTLETDTLASQKLHWAVVRMGGPTDPWRVPFPTWLFSGVPQEFQEDLHENSEQDVSSVCSRLHSSLWHHQNHRPKCWSSWQHLVQIFLLFRCWVSPSRRKGTRTSAWTHQKNLQLIIPFLLHNKIDYDWNKTDYDKNKIAYD